VELIDRFRARNTVFQATEIVHDPELGRITTHKKIELVVVP
jgi:hypothetical protein